ncbi:MAG: flagellar hook assembly protein FlgD [Azoarcus sp.]|jgi:flagellar basal-body rod modification protein FlgD|nr:flagellar hook assembly protein FlgD [Azoarcus sp.]
MSVVTDTTVSNIYSSLARTESTKATSAIQDEQDRFLKLLTTQLQNQDPTNPIENADLTSQLAQISMVDALERINALVQSLMSSSEISDSAALIGHGVLVEGKGLGLTDAGAIGGFELTTPADNVTVTIRDASGRVVTTLEFNDVEPGSHNYLWDGTAADGSQAEQGSYSVSVSATYNGEAAGVTPLQFGPVTGVVRGTSGADLQVGGLGIYKLGDIRQIL